MPQPQNAECRPRNTSSTQTLLSPSLRTAHALLIRKSMTKGPASSRTQNMQTRSRSIEHCALSKFTFVCECRQTADGQLSWLSLLGLARGRRLAKQEALKFEEAQVGRTSAGDPGNPAENPGKPAGDPGKPAGTGFAKKVRNPRKKKSDFAAKI